MCCGCIIRAYLGPSVVVPFANQINWPRPPQPPSKGHNHFLQWGEYNDPLSHQRVRLFVLPTYLYIPRIQCNMNTMCQYLFSFGPTKGKVESAGCSVQISLCRYEYLSIFSLRILSRGSQDSHNPHMRAKYISDHCKSRSLLSPDEYNWTIHGQFVLAASSNGIFVGGFVLH